MLLGTQRSIPIPVVLPSTFQSPERIHAFGNLEYPDFVLDFDEFQSPERIHAFGNVVQNTGYRPSEEVSIPREDSCFWEPVLTFPTNKAVKCFNPQRGFMLLGTIAVCGSSCAFQVSIPREDSCFWEPSASGYPPFTITFQSPERIHAFGNNGGTDSNRGDGKFQSPERIHAFGNSPNSLP